MHFYRTTFCVFSIFLAAPVLGGEISGRVLNAKGKAVEQARIAVAGESAQRFTDVQGRFRLEGCQIPCTLVISHPRFVEKAVDVTEPPEGELEIELGSKQSVFEEITVTASRGASNAAPVSLASTVVEPEELPTVPSTLTELAEGTAGVAENGQGGIFQVLSIRGVSRQRVMSLVAGVPVFGERRAGVSTSFIDPLLMGSVEVLRGPASTYYGSGALGGVIQVLPRAFDDLSVTTGWDSAGDENYLAVGWGEDGWSIGLARRDASSTEDPNGALLPSFFTQYSATVTRSWQTGDWAFDFLVAPSYGEDIGKPNSDFPERVTVYPVERHLLTRLAATSPRGDRFQLYAHPNDLETEVTEGTALNVVENDAFDFGFGWQREWQSESGLTGLYGVDYTARHSVDSLETDRDLADGSVSVARTLDSAQLDELAAFGSVHWSWGSTGFQAGTRFTWQEQQNGDLPSRSDDAWSGFIGAVHPFGKGFELVANVGTGLRFPTLSERFFNGTTGRGDQVGNPDLEAERSLNLDLGLRWYGEKVFLSGQVFRLEIDDYIERIRISPETRTFVNLSSGTIEGLEIEGFYELGERWLLSWNGHTMEGRDEAGEPLADVPPDRVELRLRYREDRWLSQLRYQVRAEKNDPGSGELAIPSAQLVSAALSYELSSDLRVTLRGENLLDEAYFNSADDQSVLSPGRSVGLSLQWGLL